MTDDGAGIPATARGSSFVNLRIRFHEVANLLHCPGRRTATRRMYIRTILEPGNIAAVSPLFMAPAQLPLETVMQLPPSLCLKTTPLSTVLVELWRILDEAQHELIGSRSATIERLLATTPSTRLALAHRNGKACVTSLTISATTSPSSQQASIQMDGPVDDSVTKSAEQSALELTFVVLEVVGLEEDMQPALVVALRADAEASSSWSDIGVADEAVATTYIWNHQWQFILSPLACRDEVLELRVFTEDYEREAMKAEVSIASPMASNSSACESWIQIAQTSNTELAVTKNPQAHIAWYWTHCETREVVQRCVERYTHEEDATENSHLIAPKQATRSPRISKLALPSLSSTIAIGVQSLCRLSGETIKWISRFLEANKRDPQQLLIRVQLESSRDYPSSECSVPGSSVRLESDHCPGQVCAILGDCLATTQIPMPVELAAFLWTDGAERDEHIYQAVIKIQPSALKLWGLSSSFAVAPVLREITTSRRQVGWRFALLDLEEVVAGEVFTVVSYGSPELHNAVGDCSASPWIHDQQPRRALCHLRGMKPTCNTDASESTSTQSLQLRIWTNSTGRRGGCVISALAWTTAGDEASCAYCVLSVHDISSEVFYVELCRLDGSRRILSVGEFTAATELDGVVVEKQVALFSARDHKKADEVAKAIIQVTLDACEGDSASTLAPTLMASSSSLRGVSYPCGQGEDQNSLSLRLEQLRIFQGTARDLASAASVELRLSTQSRWSSATQWTVATSKADGQAIVDFNEHFEAPIRWSAKDRCLPFLQIRVKLRQRQQQEPVPPLSVIAKSDAMKATKAATSTPVKLYGGGTPLAGNGGAKESVKPRIASAFEQFDLDLSAFFALASGWTRLCIPLSDAPSSKSGALGEEKGQPTATLLLQVCVGKDQDQRLDRSASPRLFTSPPPSGVHGDVSVHLQQANGIFLQTQDVETASFRAILAWMGMSTSTCQVNLTRDRQLLWNDYLALPVSCEAAPVLELRILKRAGNNLESTEHLVASASFPVFPALSTNQHLMHCELPLSTPTVENTLASSDKGIPIQERRRVGMLSMDVQFIDRSGTKTPSNDSIELVIHEMRGVTQYGPDPGSRSLVRLEVYALKDSSNSKRQSIWAATPFVVALARSSETTTVNELVDLSTFEIPDAGLAVIAVEISDIRGDSLGCANIPLNKSWKKRLLSATSRPNWYKVIGNHPTDAAVLVSFQRAREDAITPPQPTGRGGLYLEVMRAVVRHDLDVNSATTASVEISRDVIKRKTRRTTWSAAIDGWQWEDQSMSFHQVGLDPGAGLQCELAIEGPTRANNFRGEFHIPDNVQADNATSLTEWIPLATTDQSNASQGPYAFVLVQVRRLPPVTGMIALSFRSIQSLGREKIEFQVDNSFLTCTFQSKTFTTLPLEDMAKRTAESSDGDFLSLRIPFTTDARSLPRTPFLVITWMGQSSTFGEVCLGSCAIDLATCISTRPLAGDDAVWAWHEFRDRTDRSSITAICQMRIAFHATHKHERQREVGPNACPSRMQQTVRDNAETLAIWKKFFYLLDKDENGVIDLGEFTEMFARNLDDMKATTDGKKLLALLFNVDDAPPESSRQIRTLFAAMDSDGDERIQWNEYLAFLRRRQHQREALHPAQHEAPPSISCDVKARVPTSSPPQLDTSMKKEMRRKNREDRRIGDPSDVEASASTRSRKQPASRSALPVLGKSELELNAKLVALTATLELERQKHTTLHENWQALHRSYQQLHLKQQQDMIQEQLRAKRVIETIERQEAQLRDREVSRKRQHDASIVLQCTLRSRLEQKRYHAIKVDRANAAITLQCWHRQRCAIVRLKHLKEDEEHHRMIWRSAVKIQRFVRHHLRRKEQQLMMEARHLSARIVQKIVRGMLARVSWMTHRRACITIQCWARRELARADVKRLRAARVVMGHRVRLWVCARRYQVTKSSATRLQIWWRRVYAWRCEHLEQVEAAMCVQAAWRGKLARMLLQRRRVQYKIFCVEVKAIAHIQIAWRRSQQRTQRRLSAEDSAKPPVETSIQHEASDGNSAGLTSPDTGDLRVPDSVSAEPHRPLDSIPDHLGTDDDDTVSDLPRLSEKDEEDFTLNDQGDEMLPPDGSASVKVCEIQSEEFVAGEISTQVSPTGFDTDMMQVVHGMIALIELNSADPNKDTAGIGQRWNPPLLEGLSIEPMTTDELRQSTTGNGKCESLTTSPNDPTKAQTKPIREHAEEIQHVAEAEQEPGEPASRLSTHAPERCDNPASDVSSASVMDTPLERSTMGELQSVIADLVEQVVQESPKTLVVAGDQPCLHHNTSTTEESVNEQQVFEEEPQSDCDPISPSLPDAEAESGTSSLPSQLDVVDLAHPPDDTSGIAMTPSEVSTTSDPVKSDTVTDGSAATAAASASGQERPREAAHPVGSRGAHITHRYVSLSESEDDREPRGESSADSSDLMWDAEAMAARQDSSSAESPSRSREPAPASRMYCERILSDLRRFGGPS